MAEYGEPLSEREIQVLEQVATGATNRQIAQELVVSVNTVKVHLRNIYVKLGVESRTEATLIAIRKGLVSVQTPQVPLFEPPLETEDPETPAAEPPAPLPWSKRLALIGGLILVVLVSAATWPQQKANLDPDRNLNPRGDETGQMVVLSDDWAQLAPMNISRSRFAMAVTADGTLYAIGGETSGGAVGTVEHYDPKADQWTLLTTNKPTRASNISAAIIGNRIFVPGGQTAAGQPTDIVEVYDPKDKEWTQVESLPQPLFSYALAVHDGKLYLFGGKGDGGYVNTTYIYDPQTDTWEQGHKMPTQRAYAAAAAMGSRLYVIGGYDGQHELSTCEVYDPQNDAWATCEPLTQGRGGLGLAGVANQLYAVGGGWSNYLGFSEKLELSKVWTPFETPVSRQWQNIAIAATPSKFYMAGGWSGDYLNAVWEYQVLSFDIYVPAVP